MPIDNGFYCFCHISPFRKGQFAKVKENKPVVGLKRKVCGEKNVKAVNYTANHSDYTDERIIYGQPAYPPHKQPVH